MAEQDNSGVPIAYMLLSTASSIVAEKRILALTSFLQCIRDRYKLQPRFVHTDKDTAEIKAAKIIWPDAKHQLCWWHVRRAIRQRLAMAKLETSTYNPQRANKVFDFIDVSWLPTGQADPKDDEGDMAEDDVDSIRIENTNALPKITLARPTATDALADASVEDDNESNEDDEEENEGKETEQEEESEGDDGDNPNDKDYMEKKKQPARKRKAKKKKKGKGKEKKQKEPIKETVHTFCPAEYREEIVAMVEVHLCSHPLIPGNYGTNPKAIHYWAAKKMYNFCVERELVELWAYLWVNWYRPSRWRLWARAECAEIPRLRTTMICERQ